MQSETSNAPDQEINQIIQLSEGLQKSKKSLSPDKKVESEIEHTVDP